MRKSRILSTHGSSVPNRGRRMYPRFKFLSMYFFQLFLFDRRVGSEGCSEREGSCDLYLAYHSVCSDSFPHDGGL
ncbi:hypothetical protein BDV34DRAFT_196653 [Aspergillus parasiticus]|uniref:Uncharacterized protein n=1 Tax=Aspergillus parasiticus TaxID=5067 RepID=A0A5N6DI21_ASPPA|nr:hypothetical protein BDV34DRAFT_196653 [Aspergillus parasiticus]